MDNIDVTPQVDPIKNDGKSLWEMVIKDMQDRDAFGRAKYGTPLQTFNGRVPLRDLYQELLDAVVYTKQEMEERKDCFISAWSEVQYNHYQMMVQKGFWENPRSNAELIALMHAELSEALEADRHGNSPSEHIPLYSGIAEEMADLVLRVMDFCEGNNIILGEVILAKMAYNATRPHKHGKAY